MNERELFLAALEIEDPLARRALLDSECAGDASLLARVESLLASHEGQSRFLQAPVVEQMASQETQGSAATVVVGEDSTRDDEHDPAAVEFAARGSAAPPPDSSVDEVALGFLKRSAKPGSLGRLDHYEVLEVLGMGGFGIVFRAFDEVLQRVVAIKVLAPQIAATSPARKRFLREARSSAAIQHDNVVHIYEVGEQPLPYLVMEFVAGETLQQKLDRTGPLEVSEILRIGGQIAEGLAAAHACNLIHRDIKPGNVLLGGVSQKVKITDFGLARAADDASITQSGVIAGTPLFMAPEQALGHPIDQRADLFSLGSVLYQMVSGRPPFRAPSALAVLNRVAKEWPRPIPEIIPETPDWLCNIIAKLHAKDPDERFQSAREVADLLAQCEAKLKAKQQINHPLPTPRPAAAAKSHGGKWLLPAAAVVLAAIGLAVTELAGVTHLFRHERGMTDEATKQNRPGRTEPALPTINAGIQATIDSTAWERSVAVMPAEEQVKAVGDRLKLLNSDFDGKMNSVVDHGMVIGLQFPTDQVTDISPVRALSSLQSLDINGSTAGKGSLVDISPLAGLRLKHLNIGENKVANIAPLAHMPLEWLAMWQWRGSDLTPLEGMPLKWLNCGGGGQKFDLAPLARLPLRYLCINYTQVSDLAPLADVPLVELKCANTPVTDVSPLRRAPLQRITMNPRTITRGLELLREIKSLTVININEVQPLPASSFWERYDKGEFAN